MVANYVTKNSVEDLVKKLKTGQAVSKDSVLRESKSVQGLPQGDIDSGIVQKEAADPDIEVGSRIVSLKCPISAMRIQTPVRGMGCKHNQCFDATSYLQLQEQAPTWTCPQCNKSTPWHQLVVDKYIEDILNSTGKDVDQVTVEADGRWSSGQQSTPVPNNRKRKANATPESDDDDDLVIIDNDGPSNGISAASLNMLTPSSSVRTPPVNGLNIRESSVATSQRSTSKRPRQQEVIDLTGSDDEDEDQDARPPTVKSRPSFPTPAATAALSATSNNYLSSVSNYNLGGGGSGSLNAGSVSPVYTHRPPSRLSTSTNSAGIVHQPPRPASATSNSNNRYQFHLPPPNSPQQFNFTNSFGSGGHHNNSSSNHNSSSMGGYGPANGGSASPSNRF